jgi:hypothetical protein
MNFRFKRPIKLNLTIKNLKMMPSADKTGAIKREGDLLVTPRLDGMYGKRCKWRGKMIINKPFVII